MSIRSLFNIILKVLGIFFIKDILESISQLAPVSFYLAKPDTAGEAIWPLLSTLFILLVYGFVCYYLIFKSEVIIDKLKLDSGFEEQTIALNMHRSDVLSICMIVIGGLILANEIPNLCRQLYSYFQIKRMTDGQTDPGISYSVLASVKIIIGLLLIGYQRQIVNFIELRRREAEA